MAIYGKFPRLVIFHFQYTYVELQESTAIFDMTDMTWQKSTSSSYLAVIPTLYQVHA